MVGSGTTAESLICLNCGDLRLCYVDSAVIGNREQIMKRVAIIGSGISGLVASYILSQKYDVTVYEKNDYLGGHTNTIDVQNPVGQSLPVDTGFIVFNDRTYPGFIRLLEHLGISALDTTMSFSVRCDKTGIEYCGSSLNGLFAQRRNLFRPSFYQFLSDFRRFSLVAENELVEADESITVGDYFGRHRYSDAFYQRYFLPMGAAIWSCPRGIFESFPIRFIAKFYKNHGLLGIRNRPQWKVIAGGSRQYVRKLCRRMVSQLNTGHDVSNIQRIKEEGGAYKVQVSGRLSEVAGGRPFCDVFDHVVVACHADQALQLVDSVDSDEKSVLSAFPYEPNTATLHSDCSVMPQSPRAWAAWNYRIPECGDRKATVTYDMNRLQRLTPEQSGGRNYFVTLNDGSAIDPSKIEREISYSHPIFSVGREAAQARHDQLIDRAGLSYCGAYWGNGFHEDGVQSALRVCRKLLGEDPWNLISTPGGSHTDAKLQSSTSSVTQSSWS